MDKKNLRTDQFLEPDIIADAEIIGKMADKLYYRFKSSSVDRDDLVQFLSEAYLKAVLDYDKKPRAIPKRPFVFNNIRFIIKRIYRGQYRFDNKFVFPMEAPESSETDAERDTRSLSDMVERNPFLFGDNVDLSRILGKYTFEDQMIIYYRFYLNKQINKLHLYLGKTEPLKYSRVKSLKIRLQRDHDLLNLLKENGEG